MSKTVAIAAVVVLAVIGLSAYTYSMGVLGPVNGSIGTSGRSSNTGSSATGLGSPGTGALSIYLTDSPHSNVTLRYLLLNVTSVTLRYASMGSNCGGNTTTTTSTSTSVNTTSTSINSTSTGTGGANNTFVYTVPPSVGTNVNITSLHGQGLLLGATSVPAGEVVQITLGVSGAEAFWSTGPPTQLKVVANGKLMVPVHFTVNPDGSTTLTIDVTPSDIHVSQGNLKVLTPVVHVTVVQTGGCASSTTSTTSTNSTSTAVTTSSTSTNTNATSSTTTSVTNSTSVSTTSVTNSTSTSTNSTSTSTTS